MPEPTKPPKGAFRILSLFSGDPVFPHIAGDMGEEFHQRVCDDGEKQAKRWYWRELFRNMLILAIRQLQLQNAAIHAMTFCYRQKQRLGIVAVLQNGTSQK